MINILSFCDTTDGRDFIKSPFNFSGMTVSTNCYVILFSPQSPDFSEPVKTPKFVANCHRRISAAENFVAFSELKISLPEKTTCSECGGKGKLSLSECPECDGYCEVEFSNEHSEYRCDCKTCGAEGNVKTTDTDTPCIFCGGDGVSYDKCCSVSVLGLQISCRFMQLIYDAPDLIVSAVNGMLLFKSGAQCGAIMSLRGDAK